MIPAQYAAKLQDYCIQRAQERIQIIGSGLNLLEMFLPAIPELAELEATEEDILANLQRGKSLDLLDVYQHRTDCQNCSRQDYSECPLILRTYSVRSGILGLAVTYDRDERCKVQSSPYKEERIRHLMGELKLPAEFADKTVNEYRAQIESQITAKNQCVNYVNGYPDLARAGKGLVFTGPTGTGKTHLVVGLAKGIIQMHTRVVRFIDVGVWASDFVYGSRSFEDKKTTIERMKRAELLILDDLGAEQDLSSKNTVVGALQLILKQRTNDARPTVITTNMPRPDLQEYLGQRIWSRVYQKSEFIALTGSDYRGLGQFEGWGDVGKERNDRD